MNGRFAVALVLGMSPLDARAEVVRLEIASRTAIAMHSGELPQYELITGRYFGELDPEDSRNVIITDLSLAPRNAEGKVEYSATFAISRPVNPRDTSGVLFYDVPNRGNGAAVTDRDGHIHVISGWQGDIPAAPGLQSATVPVARNADGSSVTGPVLVRFLDVPPGTSSLPIRGGLGIGVPRPAPLSLDTSRALLTHRRSDTDRATRIPSSDWAFADCTREPFPGKADPASLCVKEGFDPALAYELTYNAKDPPVLGIGFAAVRDLVVFLRYSSGTPLAPNPVAGIAHHTIGTGVSQSGNFLRSFVRLGFNAGEDGRMVFDGINPHIAARLLALNLRFAVPGGAAALFEPGSDGVLWWGSYRHASRGPRPTSLLDRCLKDGTCPKIMETFGSAELWGLRMSPDLVGIDAKADIPLPVNVRRYYFPGITHGGGSGGFATSEAVLPKAAGCRLAANPNPSFHSMRALYRVLVAWVADGKEPPPSRYPRLDHGDLVVPTRAAMGFPAIPGQPSPEERLNSVLVYDFGPAFRATDLSGEISIVPPKVVGTAPSVVPRVNGDGNETSGVPSVQHRVPLGTYLGWNVQASGYYRDKGCGFQGGFIPFAVTRAERIASGDPRLSLEERYGTHAGFVDRVRAAAADVVSEGFLLPEDARQIVYDAERSDVLKTH